MQPWTLRLGPMVLVGVVLRRPSSVRREAVMDELPREVGRASRREETRTWVARRRERGRHRRPVWKSKRRLDAAVAASARWREGLHNNLTHWLTSAQPGTSRDTPSPRARSRRPPRRAARRSRGTTTDPSARSGSTWIKCGSRWHFYASRLIAASQERLPIMFSRVC